MKYLIKRFDVKIFIKIMAIMVIISCQKAHSPSDSPQNPDPKVETEQGCEKTGTCLIATDEAVKKCLLDVIDTKYDGNIPEYQLVTEFDECDRSEDAGISKKKFLQIVKELGLKNSDKVFSKG